jgi:hypothetical protein
MTARMTLTEVARALGGEVQGHQVRAPGPGHSRLDQGAPQLVPVKLGVTDGNVTEIVSGLDRREVIIGRAEHADRSR